MEEMLTICELDVVRELLKRYNFPETRWYELGLTLGLYKNTLDVIEMNYPLNVYRQLIECLSQWLRRADKVNSKGGATFDSLSDALKFMNENDAADKLDQENSAQKIMATGGDAVGETGGDINCRPGIENLKEFITTLERSDFPADRWSDLGLNLHITQPKLDTIGADNPQNAKECLKGCLILWLQQDYDVDTHGKPSLEKLATAVKEMRLRAVADKILEKIKSEGSSEKREDNDLDLPRISDTIESDVYKEFHELKSTFADIVAKIREHLEAKVKRIARFVEEYLDSEDIMLTNEVSIDILFKRIKSHYSYLSCRLIEAIVDKHVDKSCQLQEEWKTYIKRMNRFKKSKRLKDLQSTIEKSYDRIISSTDTACVVVIKLSGGWDEKTISDLESLLRHYFENEEIFNHLRITPGSVCISYLVPRSAIAHITRAVKSKSESMCRVGVFYFSINDDVLLDEKDNVNFDESLIEAVKLDESFEVSLLLSLGADPYYEDSNGGKALELAVQGGNEEIMELITVATDTQVIELESQEELTDEEDKETGNNGENKTLKVEIQRLQVLSAELEKSLAASKSEIEKLQETISFQKKETEAELQTCKKKLNASYLENERLDRVLDKTRDDSRVLQNTISLLETNILSLRNERIINEKILLERTKEIAILQDKISSLSVQLIDQPSRIVPRIDKFTQSEAITTMDQSVQSMEILLPEIDRNQMKIEGMLTIDDLIDVLNLLKRCDFPQGRWKELGLTLGLLKNTLDALEVTFCGDVSRCLLECLSQWLSRADNVDSKGGATFDSLSDALKSMNENAAADKLDQEKRKAKAIDIFNTHHPLLSQSLSDPVSVAIMLQREGVITGQVLASVESASPSVPNQREVLLAAIIVAIHSKYSLLQTFARVLCKFTSNVKLGTVIQRDYDTHFAAAEFVDIHVLEEDATSEGAGAQTTTVEIPVRKSKSREFSSIRASLGRMLYKVHKAILKKPLAIDDIKLLIISCNSDLRGKLDNCSDISSVVHVIEGECSLTDISLLETVVEEFEVTEAERYIEQYKTSLEKSCHSLSIDLCLKEKFDAAVKCESATYVFDWRPDEKKLKDIVDILSKTSGKRVKIKFIDASY